MITFIWIFAAVILVGFLFFIARSAGKRNRSGQAGEGEVRAEQNGGGAPTISRASGKD